MFLFILYINNNIIKICQPNLNLTKPKSFAEVIKTSNTPKWKVSTNKEV